MMSPSLPPAPSLPITGGRGSQDEPGEGKQAQEEGFSPSSSKAIVPPQWLRTDVT